MLGVPRHVLLLHASGIAMDNETVNISNLYT
jgi:hypothetical protein